MRVALVTLTVLLVACVPVSPMNTNSATSSSSLMETPVSSYGVATPYHGLTVRFPDFTIKFSAEGETPPPDPSFVLSFEIQSSEGVQNIYWSPGKNGKITPVPFSVGEKKFVFHLGRLPSGEAIPSGELLIEQLPQ